MAHHLGLRQVGQADGAAPGDAAHAVEIHRTGLGQVDAAAAVIAHLEDQLLLDLKTAITADRLIHLAHHTTSFSAATRRSMSSSVLVSVTARISTGASSGQVG